MSEQEERLNWIGELAEEYARLSLEESTTARLPEVIHARGLRARMREIAALVAQQSAIEATHFAQGIVSRCPNVHLASMWITVLTNRMLDSVGR